MRQTIGRCAIAMTDVRVWKHDYPCPRHKRRTGSEGAATLVSGRMTIRVVDTNDGLGGEWGREAAAPESGHFVGRTRPGEGFLQSAEIGDDVLQIGFRCPGGYHLSVLCPLPPEIPDRIRVDRFLIVLSWLVSLFSWLGVGAFPPPTESLPPTERTRSLRSALESNGPLRSIFLSVERHAIFVTLPPCALPGSR